MGRIEQWEPVNRFGISPSGTGIRDYKHSKTIFGIEEYIKVLNMVNDRDNKAVDLIRKELDNAQFDEIEEVLSRILAKL